MEEKKVRTCVVCKTPYEYETEEDLLQFFYKKKTHTGDYFLNTCKKCECAKHADKYKKGKYNYKKKREYDYFSGVRVFSRGSTEWDE